jgi:hypothetical protein
MAKGYMIFLEGGEMPKVVHPNIAAAMFVAKRVAKKFPEREVLLFHIEKRGVHKAGEEKYTALPCHIPDNFDKTKLLILQDMVHKNELEKYKNAFPDAVPEGIV